MIDTLPNEIVLLILVELDKKDIFSFLQTCRTFLDFIRDELFWRDFIYRKYLVKYRDPTLSWWQLFSSGDASEMCCHINVAMTHPVTLKTKKSMVWSIDNNDDVGICMEPQCQFMGYDDTYFKPGQLDQHYQDTGHSIVLKLSLLNYMELWCYACHRPIGLCMTRQTSSEKYLCSAILKELTQLPTQSSMIEKKRRIEQTIATTYQYNYTFLVEKQWFTIWIQFLMGKSNNIPSSLDNSILFHKDKLRPDLIIGIDYELVGSSIKLYIERIYGLLNNSKIISTQEVNDEPTKYRSILHSIQLNRQFY